MSCMHNDIPQVPLANGTTIPQLGLGVFQVTDPNEVKDAIKWALAAGYRHIDTATYYQNEEAVGEAIKESGISRDDLFVTSKLWNNVRGYEETKQAFQTSLDKLGLDYLNLYLIHWPADGYVESWKALEDLYKDGKIKAIGVSNFEQNHLENLMSQTEIKPMVDQIETHPFFQQKELHAYLEKNGIQHESWSPLGGGRNNALSHPLIKRLAENHDVTPAQIILRWHVQRDEVIIPKSVHQERIEQNRDIFAFGLDEDEMQSIADIDAGKRVGADPQDKEWLAKSTTYGGPKK